METSREAARIAIENTIAQLKEIVPGIPLDAPITLHAITPYSQTLQTTFGREVIHFDKCYPLGFVDCLMSLSSIPAVVCRVTRCSSLVYGMRVWALQPSPCPMLIFPQLTDSRRRRRTGHATREVVWIRTVNASPPGQVEDIIHVSPPVSLCITRFYISGVVIN